MTTNIVPVPSNLQPLINSLSFSIWRVILLPLSIPFSSKKLLKVLLPTPNRFSPEERSQGLRRLVINSHPYQDLVLTGRGNVIISSLRAILCTRNVYENGPWTTCSHFLLPFYFSICKGIDDPLLKHCTNTHTHTQTPPAVVVGFNI